MTLSANPLAGLGPAVNAFENLSTFGWTSPHDLAFRARFGPPVEPGRVVAASRGLALVRTASGERLCTPSGRMRERLLADDLTLCAGDWIALRLDPGDTRGRMVDLLERGPSLTRQGPDGRPQCLAANLDVVFLVMGLDRDCNAARLERFLALAWGSGARPVVVLTKVDLNDRAEAFAADMRGVAPGVQVLEVCAPAGQGVARVGACLQGGLTGVLTGSSGAGKSTLLNALLGEDARPTGAVRASDGRGRHTTTRRELFPLPGGGCLIETPGVREVGLGAEGADLDTAFSEIAALAARCRFRDCAHGAEPGCAVREALDQGLLGGDRYGHYLQLRREVAFEAARGDERLWREREDKWRRISKAQKSLRKR
ncbi:ribosome small subunit-dependent GTPase A [Mesoterricola silvestris]|uniref:Small ribosomal subunit biogenesis GTPase RsgA n=1 Tax=Mesoterricola silvestris TaxID=2927979 RepID=A0AA48GIE9_9BACT|nr:ribosome small subunit-dependent GTPase A [Mesoterricola silvestris]BDU71589.1 putative ribosome biogenesis GTPase RsgA [Mesoterricola silvestris]